MFKKQNDEKTNVISGDQTQGRIIQKGLWKRFFHMCRTARLPYIMLAGYIIAYAVQGELIVKIPQINGNFFAGDASVKSVTMFLVFEILSMLISQALLFYNYVIRAKMNRNLQNALWGKILRLKPKYFDKVSASTLLSRITIDCESMNGFVMDIILDMVFQIYMLVLTIREMSAISLKAGFMLLAFVPLSLLMAFVVGRINQKLENGAKFKMADLTMYLSELISCLPLLKAFNRQGYESARGKKVINDYFKAQNKILGFDLIRSFVGSLVSIGPEIVIITLGIKMLANNTVDAEGWYVFYIYAGTLIGFVNQMAGKWESVKSLQGTLNKVSDVLYEEEESVEPYVKEIVESGDIMFDNVTFAYNDEDDPVLVNACLTIPKNKNTALIGYSGSGKSTILKLLDRMYEPDEGRILTRGDNIGDYPVDKWRRKITYVTQNTPLMSGSIRENILYGIDREVSDEGIMEAAALANVDEFISGCEDGLDYEVGQFGSKLSGGQRQKISIARAILTDCEIMVLDEPTASLDIISTNEILNTIDKIRGTRTVIIVTHEAKAVRGADHIIVVEKDHSVFEGSEHDMELMSKFYNELMNEEKENGYEA